MTVTLQIKQTSAGCVRYQIVDAAGKRLWLNRVVDCPEGHAGARKRMAAWCKRYGVTVREARRAA